MTWLSGRSIATLANNSDLVAVSVRCHDRREAVILTNAVVNMYFDEVTNYNLEAKECSLSRLDRLVEEQRQHSTDLKGVENRQRQENSSIRNSHASHTGEVLLFGDWLAAEVRRSAEAEDVTGLRDG